MDAAPITKLMDAARRTAQVVEAAKQTAKQAATAPAPTQATGGS